VLNRVGPAPTPNYAVARGMPKFQTRLPDRVHTYSRPQRRWPTGTLGIVQGHVAPSVAQHGSARTDRQLGVPEMAGVLTAVPARDLKKDLPALIDKVRSAGYPSGYLPSMGDRRGDPGIDRAGPCRARSLPRGGVHWRVGVTPGDRNALGRQAAWVRSLRPIGRSLTGAGFVLSVRVIDRRSIARHGRWPTMT
jgi:hypothetical protein